MTKATQTYSLSKNRNLTSSALARYERKCEGDVKSAVSYTPPRRNPVTGDGVVVPPPRRRHPASYRGADPLAHQHPEHVQTYLYDPIIYPQGDPLEPQPSHRYLTRDWPPRPGQYNVESTAKPQISYRHTPYSLIGLQEEPQTQILEINSDSLSPQPILDGQCPPFPAQHEFNTKAQDQIPYDPLFPHSYITMKSVLDESPSFQHGHNPVPTFDGSVDPYLISNLNPAPTFFKYERDGPIPDVTLLQTPQAPGPFTLLGFPPTFHKHVPSYLFNKERHTEELASKQGNPITGDGYKSMNGEINTVTGLHDRSSILHNRVPPGGFSSGLW
ncbi:hypothetical protein EVAR_80750_1 [Eumeta japonica]|uniref:Uncharacterized protein n=1 Tax=Eumeta variegata TaxID=151549 RepID=A0A4C1X8B9_EUMVA|nr:hypothetical protein EVAR_80750_1 [Eumeta japonica]